MIEHEIQWWPIVASFLPLIITCASGLYFRSHPPKERNLMVGYRTKRSMKTEEAWNFAQVYATNLLFTWSLAGIVGLTLQIVFNKMENDGSLLITSISIMVVMLIGLFYFTERELKNRFG